MDIFSVSVEDLESTEKKSNFGANEFKPNPNQAKDNVYRALVRPVYWLDNIKKPFIPKTTFYFDKEDGNNTGNHFFDSPYSIQEDCLAMKTFFDLKRDKENARSRQLADEIRPKSSFFYLVLVEMDETHPENEGKLMVYKAPIQVHRIIQGAIAPSEGDQKMGVTPCNVFDPFNGKSLRLSIDINGKNWNYNGTVSLTEKQPTKFEGAPLTVEKKDAFVEFLKGGNELMSPYVYTPMTDDRTKLLYSIITDKTGIQLGGEKIVKSATIDIEGLSDEPKVEATKVEAPVVDETSSTPEVAAFEAEAKQPEEVKEVEKEVEKTENDDQFFNDLLEGVSV